jgi:hypothetical protein
MIAEVPERIELLEEDQSAADVFARLLEALDGAAAGGQEYIAEWYADRIVDEMLGGAA